MSWGGFKLDGHTATSLGILMRDGPTVPILPSTRDRIIEVPGRNGAWDFGADLSPLRIIIPCSFVYASTEQEMFTQASTLADLLTDEVTNKPRTVELIFEAQPEKIYDVRYSGAIDFFRRVFDGEFSLPLVAFDPIPREVDS